MQPFFANWVFWLYVSVLLPYGLFVFFYARRSPWRDSHTGRGLMAVAASITAVLSFAVIALVAPIPENVRDWLRVVLLGAVEYAGWLQLRNLLREQRTRRDESACPARRSTD